MGNTSRKKDRCADCERPLEPWDGPLEDRPPCPRCGGTGRAMTVSITETVTVSDSVSVVKVRKTSLDRLLEGFPAWSVRTPELKEATWARVTDGLDAAKTVTVVVSLIGYPLEGAVTRLVLIPISRKVREKRIEAAKREAVADDD